MDKRIGSKLDSDGTCNVQVVRPIPACSKVRSQFDPAPITVLDTAGIIVGPTLHMRVFKRRFVFRIGVVLLILFWATALRPERPRAFPFRRANLFAPSRSSAIRSWVVPYDHVDPNGHDAEGRTPLLIADVAAELENNATPNGRGGPCRSR